MAGIYIHIPFCKQACSYCDFHFSTNLSRKTELLQAIEKEIDLRREYVNGEEIETIYFGGGTPSLLSKQEINQLLKKVYAAFEVIENPEITLEANPDDLTIKKLNELAQTKINRLSIGVQSFFEEDLRFMNRAHSSIEAITSIKNSQADGFKNISVDLIFGSQTTTDVMWQNNLDTFFSLNIPHLSAYSLTVEEKTALANQIEKKKVAPVDEEKNYKQYLMLQTAMKKHGFEQYELSNYSANKNYSKHNTAYWFGITYLGLGPSAHSYNGKSRQWNLRNNKKYIEAIIKKRDYFEMENLSEIEKYHDYLITSLRTKWGINFETVKNKFTNATYNHFMAAIIKVDSAKVNQTNSSFSVKNECLFQSDEIVRQLMMD